MKPVKVLGLDLSLTASGIYCDTCGGSIFKTKLRGMERLQAIRDEVVKHALHSDIILVEGYAFGARGNAMFSIGELGGVIRLALYELSKPYIEIAPTQLKKFATGKGNANKDEVIAAAIRKFNFQGTDNNEADAYVLNRIGNSHYNGSIRTSVQQEVVDKIEWRELV
jgi:crossover junction endodeoxyribonuclease RuvC